MVTPFTAARNWTPLQSEVVVNQGSMLYVASSGCMTFFGLPELPIGRPSYQLLRFRTSAGYSQSPPPPPPSAPEIWVSEMLVHSFLVLPCPTIRT